MGQVLHGGATTTAAVRRAIQHSQESLRGLAKRYGINPKTAAKWRGRSSVQDLPTGPKQAQSTVLSAKNEAVVPASRWNTLLPLDDCLYALRATIPHLTRSSVHRCLQQHGISRLPELGSAAPGKRKFKSYPLGYVHIDIAEVVEAQVSSRTLDGRALAEVGRRARPSVRRRARGGPARPRAAISIECRAHIRVSS